MKQFLCLLMLGLVFLTGQNLFAMSADEVLQSVEDRYVGKTSQAAMNMILMSPDGKSRKRDMTFYRRKVDNQNKDNFIVFQAPPDIKDTTYLVNEKGGQKEKRMYLSAMKNIRKIIATDYNMAFVASDFTYEDMEDMHAANYACSNLKEEKLGEENVYSIEAKKKESNTSYDKLVLLVSKEKKMILKATMFDKKAPDKIIKEMQAKGLKKIQDIWTAMEVEMKDLVKGTSTTLKSNDVKYDTPLGDEMFSERNMKKD